MNSNQLRKFIFSTSVNHFSIKCVFGEMNHQVGNVIKGQMYCVEPNYYVQSFKKQRIQNNSDDDEYTTWSCICVVSIQHNIIQRQHVFLMCLIGNCTPCWGKHRWACKKYFVMYKVLYPKLEQQKQGGGPFRDLSFCHSRKL